MVCLALIGFSGSVFAQVCFINDLQATPCACEFAMENLAISAFATLQGTETIHEAGGTYSAAATWSCGSTTQLIVFSSFRSEGTWACSSGSSFTGGSACTDLGSGVTVPGLTGQQNVAEKKAARDILNGIDSSP